MLPPYCRLNTGKYSKKSVFLWFESHRRAIHAISEAGFGRTVGKNMAEMTVAGGAPYFDAAHAETIVLNLGNRFAIGGYREARPAATAVEFAFRFKQFAAATGAEKFPVAIFGI